MSKKLFVILGIVLAATIIAHAMLLGGAPYHQLAKAAPLDGVVSQALVTNGTSAPPVGGKDFTLQSVHTFGNDWLVASIVPTPTSKLTKSTVVLEKREGVFQVVLGPGTAFDNSVLVSLPADLGNYLTQQGYIYEFSYK